jgi:hypothetical protein
MTMWSRMLLELVYIHILDMDYIILLYGYLQLPLLLSNQYGTQNILLLQLPLALASDPHIRFLVFGYILTIPLCIHAFLGTPLTRRIRSFVYTTRSMTIAQGVEEVGYVGFALVYTYKVRRNVVC